MDIEKLIADAKARFSHNSAKDYLKAKYESKLIIAACDGLWVADQKTIGFLSAIPGDQVVLIDTFNNPVLVNRIELLQKLQTLYSQVMIEWHNEWQAIESMI